jgi:hypothetical protein
VALSVEVLVAVGCRVEVSVGGVEAVSVAVGRIVQVLVDVEEGLGKEVGVREAVEVGQGVAVAALATGRWGPR